MKYRMIAEGVNFAKGRLANFPSFAMGSFPDLIWRPPETRLVVFFETSVPSNVSVSASSMRKVLLRMVMRVELSLRTRRAALTAAKGPDVKAIIAACGRYVKTNIEAVMPTPRVSVGISLLVNGRHSDRCDRKYAMPLSNVS